VGFPPAAIPEQSRADETGTTNTVEMLGGIPAERKDSNMKNISKAIMYLQMTVLCLTAALADPAAAEKQLPLRGTIQAVEKVDVQFPTMFVDGSGTGQATHLGQFTFTYESVVDLLIGCGVGSAEFTAANGDRLFTELTGCGGPTDAGYRVVEEHTIVGGTGRFAAASGRFTLNRLLTAIANTNVSVGTVDGTIVIQ
jgi:hypothetical protein